MAVVGIEGIETNNVVRYREHLLLEKKNDTRLFYPHFVTHFLISPLGDKYDEGFTVIDIEPIKKNMNPLSAVGATHFIICSEINLTDGCEEGFIVINTEPIAS